MIGAWWVYIMINFESFLGHTDRPRITKMLAWEGGSFLVLLMLLSISLLVLYLKDQRKTKSLPVSYTHLTLPTKA